MLHGSSSCIFNKNEVLSKSFCCLFKAIFIKDVLQAEPGICINVFVSDKIGYLLFSFFSELNKVSHG